MPFDPTKPVRFADPEDTRKVRVLATDVKGVRPIAVAVEERGEERVVMVAEDGVNWLSSSDIVNAPETHSIEFSIGVWKDDDGNLFTHKCESRGAYDLAVTSLSAGRKKLIAWLPFSHTFNEGDGL